jgi:hypothetical protein
MKKFIAGLMAFIFIFNGFPFSLVQVYAAYSEDFQLNSRFDMNLKTISASDSPIINGILTDVPADTVTLDFSLKNMTIGEDLVLNYALDRNTFIKLILNKDNDEYITTRFEMLKYEGATWNPAVFDPLVYSSRASNYVKAELYESGDGDAHQLIREPADPAQPLTGYSFKFKEDQGFSFKLGSMSISFKHTKGTDNFTFTTNQIKKGFVYNFILTDKTGAIFNSSNQAKVYSGISQDTIDFIPLANDTAGGYAVIKNDTNDTITSLKNNNYVLNYSETGNIFPAGEDVAMAVRFDMPMELPTASFLSTPPTGPITPAIVNNTTYDIDFTLLIKHNLKAYDEGKLYINNILDLTAKAYADAFEIAETTNTTSTPATIKGQFDNPVKTAGGPVSTARLLEKNNTRAEIVLKDLKPGMLFNIQVKSELKNTVGTEKITNSAGFYTPLGTAFTFLEYRFVYDGVEFKMQFDPYSGHSGGYRITAKDGITQIQTSSGNIPITAPINRLLKDDFIIEFMPGYAGDTFIGIIYSEWSSFNAKEAPLELGAAREFTVESHNLKALPSYDPGESYGSRGTLDMTLSWQLAFADAIKNEINKQTQPQDKKFNVSYNLLKSLENNHEKALPFAHVVLEIFPDLSDNDVYKAKYEIYDIADIENGAPKAGANPVYEDTSTLEIKDERFVVAIDLKDIPAERRTGTVENTAGYKFIYKNIYYLGAETLPPTTGIKKISTFDTMTLSDITDMEIPPLKNLRSVPESLGETSFEMRWSVSGEQLRDYYKSFPFDMDKDNFKYHIFVSHDENAIKKLSGKKYEDILSMVNSFDYAAPVPAGTSDYTVEFSQSQLNNLRDGKVLHIKDLEENNKADFLEAVEDGLDFTKSISFLGTDKNQTYYIYALFEIDHMDIEKDPDEELPPKYSKLSPLFGITTKGDKAPPDGTDKRPPAPAVSIKDVAIDSMTAYWKHADRPAEGSSEKIYYEVIRTKGKQIDSKYLDSYEAFDDFYKRLSNEMPDTEKVFLITDTEEGLKPPKIFDGRNYTDSSADKMEVLTTKAEVELRDKSLSSNSIYFYYVRTVRVVTDEEGNTKKIVSVWNYNTGTTSTVGIPINLKAESSASGYDPKTEMIITFDAPLASLTALGTEYGLQYSIKEDDGDYGSPVTMDHSVLKNAAKEAALKGYFSFSYKISGLKPNTMYSIRVRLINLKSSDTSMWSNIAVSKTHMDQDDYFNDKEVGSWLDYYKENLTALFKNNYWVTQNAKNKFSAVYRPTMFESLLSGTTGTGIEMPTGIFESGSLTYYIPASSIAQANSAQKGFVLEKGNLQIIASPDMVNTDLNESIKKLTDRIAKNDIKDYYVVMNIEFRAYSQSINGQNPLSENMVINLSVEGSTIASATWDNERLAEYLEKIESEAKSESVRKRISSMIENKSANEDIVKYISSLVSDFEKDMVKKNEASFKKTLKLRERLQVFDGTMIMVLRAEQPGLQASGYRLDSVSTPLQTIAYGTGKAFYVNSPGSYIFAGLVIDLQGMPNQPNAGTTYAIVGKYGLSEFLGYNGSINTAQNASRKALLGSAARMAGAPQGSDPIQFFKTKGYNISGAGLDNIATNQETIYIIMAVYEAKTNTKVSTLKVRNYGVLNGVSGINETYKKSIYAAHELGIYTEKPFAPRGPVSIKNLLDMLTRLDSRANL